MPSCLPVKEQGIDGLVWMWGISIIMPLVLCPEVPLVAVSLFVIFETSVVVLNKNLLN